MWGMDKYLKIKMNIFIYILLVLFSCKNDVDDNQPQADYLGISLETSIQFQTIHNFGASDAWACQFVGKNWPIEKREAIADYLFSTDVHSDGSPIGIGLSAWRFNIGAGSAEQGAGSDINDEWRRAEGFMQPDGSFDWTRHQGQRWFLQAAKLRGVETFIGFVNSPPVALTKNGKAYSAGGSSTNLQIDNYDAYATFLTEVLSHLKSEDGIELEYISPFNEPQWDWADGGQEGSPWLNTEIAELCKKLNKSLSDNNMSTNIELPEAAQIQFLYEDHYKPGRGKQIEDFFNPTSENFIGNLERVASKIAAHSYYSTWDLDKFLNTRKELANKLAEYSQLEYAMSEYCLLENNSEISGGGRDLGIDPALYMARVIHTDLTVALASSWQWWLAVSPYDYKDGLVYIDWNKNDGTVYDSKMLWALGNYSRFILPGMKRIGIKRSDFRTIEQTLGGIMVSSFINPEDNKTVTVAINYGQTSVPIILDKNSELINCTIYRTAGGNENLSKIGTANFEEPVTLLSRSITTFVEN